MSSGAASATKSSGSGTRGKKKKDVSKFQTTPDFNLAPVSPPAKFRSSIGASNPSGSFACSDSSTQPTPSLPPLEAVGGGGLGDRGADAAPGIGFPVPPPGPKTARGVRSSTTAEFIVRARQELLNGEEASASSSAQPAGAKPEADPEAAEKSFAHGRPWHVVRAGKAGDETSAAAGGPGSIPPDTEIVVVLVEGGRPQMALNMARRLSGGAFSPGSSSPSEASPTPPIFVVLLRDAAHPSKESEAAIILNAQKVLLSASSGIYDVLLHTKDMSEMRLRIDMALVRLQCQPSKVLPTLSLPDWGSRAKLKSGVGVNSSKDSHNSAWEDHDARFWQSVHHLFPSIPAINAQLPEGELDQGTSLGGLVIERRLGCGAFGAVYKARELEDDKPLAVKVLLKDSLRGLDEISGASREISAMQRLDDEAIVKLHRVMHGPVSIYIVMELAGEVNLWRAIHRSGTGLPMHNAQGLMCQLIGALVHCHLQGVAHRDVKPENIGVGKGLRIKLFDFGCAVSTDKACLHKAGTMPFTAPEVLVLDRNGGYDPAPADVWSSGVVLLEMLCGSGIVNRWLQWPEPVDPVEERGDELARFFADGIQHVVPDLEEKLGGLPEGLEELLGGVFHVDPKRRWTAEVALEGSWLVTAQ